MGKFWTILAVLVLLAIIGAVDLGLNLISLIPGVGDALESLSEVVLEILQILVAAFGLIIVGLKR